MPQMGISEESAILTEWHIKAGDKVATGDIIFSIETGKSAFDIESEFDGTVLALIAEEGDEILIKHPVCAIGAKGETFELEAKAELIAEVSDATEKPAEAPAEPAAVAATTAASDVRGVSPRAKMLATKADVDPILASATGPEGRIIERDIRTLIENGGGKAVGKPAAAQAAPAQAPAAEFTDKPLSNMRKVIAKNMMASMTTTAQLTHTASFDATNIQQYRKLLKVDTELSGVTLTDMILYAVTRTLPGFPELNAWLMGDTMRVFSDVNLACAVDTDKGLMVPVIFGANKLSLFDISKQLKTLASGCRDGGIALNLLSGGSFTVSNLGSFGIESFTPILNAPQTGILGVNTIVSRPREVGGELKLYPCMSLSLTYDHRALDGAPASKFLQTLCKNLENFTALLAK